jgi:ABC-type uncharacterized transport system ATPase subunit
MDLVERAADRVLLMNRGREILSGSVGELHARLDDRPRLRLVMETGGDPGMLRADPDVEELAVSGDEIGITLRAGVAVRPFLARAVALAPIRGVATEAPRLHDVFVRAVREDDARAEGRVA